MTFKDFLVALSYLGGDELLERLFTQMPKREVDVLRMRAGGLSAEVVGAKFGVTRERIYQVEKRAALRLTIAWLRDRKRLAEDTERNL